MPDEPDVVHEQPGSTIRVMALHALQYCERLFYLEEVEELRVADESVWVGRRLHDELEEPVEVVEHACASPGPTSNSASRETP